jgi:hypothetical protein
MRNTEPNWHGWHRLKARAPWRMVCTAGTEGECWCELLSRVRGGDALVLRAGRHPDDKGAAPPARGRM